MPADEIINLDDYPIIGVEDPIDEGLQGSASEWGPQISYLYTNGNELWLSNLDLGINLQYVAQQESIEMARGKLNETNSYVGWYHIRNYGTFLEKETKKILKKLKLKNPGNNYNNQIDFFDLYYNDLTKSI